MCKVGRNTQRQVNAVALLRQHVTSHKDTSISKQFNPKHLHLKLQIKVKLLQYRNSYAMTFCPNHESYRIIKGRVIGIIR